MRSSGASIPMVATTRPLAASPESAIDWPGLGQKQGRFDKLLHADGEVTQNVIGLHLNPSEGILPSRP